MNGKELDTRKMLEQFLKLPDSIQERVMYIVEGASLVHRAELAETGAEKD